VVIPGLQRRDTSVLVASSDGPLRVLVLLLLIRNMVGKETMLRFVSNHVSYAFARKLSDKDVTAAEWVVLREMYGERAIAPSSLAERLGLTRRAISKLADRLIQKKLISRRQREGSACAHADAHIRGRSASPDSRRA
jgi:hypothetical protein